ncbi:hypothetical protein [Bordetella petrii]|uniref:hypothetical protein n=1 Tax=Bordetella petrii TaxID=94624 RepID=UPI0006855A17|nr:hypothetical protein [Bordetella petrii]
MTTKHTPGPWMVLPSVVPTQFAILTEHGVRQDVAVTYGFDHTPREANARLIAAAPELLEALEEFVHPYSSETLTEGERLEKARAAIAKAKGEQA